MFNLRRCVRVKSRVSRCRDQKKIKLEQWPDFYQVVSEIIGEYYRNIHASRYSIEIFKYLTKSIAVFNPMRTQIRTKIRTPRGFKMRTEEVPLQVPERLAEVQKQLKSI